MANFLDQQLRKTITASGLPVIWSTESQQQGNTFGERITRSVAQAFSLGYEQLIVLGADCPSLTAHHIAVAHQQINAERMVLGPAQDGGAYLIGLHRDHFDATTFEYLPWQTSSLHQVVCAQAHANGIATLALSSEVDIDNYVDLVRFCQYFGKQYQLLPLLKILGFHSKTISQETNIPNLAQAIITCLFRGPPRSTLLSF